MKALKLIFGNDWKFWFVPTAPVLKVNYLEKAYDIDWIAKYKKGELAEDVFTE